MFIKFSDKTKKIIVKNSAEDLDSAHPDGYLEENFLFLDEKDEKNRRIKVLSEGKKNISEAEDS
tara:strand:+ start:2928 stop:3119 length:192 start_codon:yes stop_codon:yes gene_type:complete